MKLMTKAIEKKVPALYAQEHVKDPTVHAKFFNPCGAQTWYLLERDGDTCFGYVDLGHGGAELGYFSLSELQDIKLPFGLKIERDRWWDATPLSRVMKGEVS